MTLDIYLVDLDDAAQTTAWLELLNAYASDPLGNGEALSPALLSALPARLRQRPGTWLFVASLDGRPCGLLNAFESFSTFSVAPILNVHDVFVRGDARGSGVVDALFERAEAAARAIGCCKMTLEVLAHNEPAKRVYTRLGFAHYVLDPALGGADFWERKLA